MVLELSKALIRRGVEVKIMSTSRSPLGEKGEVDGVPVAYTGHIFKVSQAQISFKLARRLMTEEADVLHTHLPYPWSADWAALTGKLRGRPAILTYHSDLVGSGWKGAVTGAYRYSVLQATLSLVDRIVVTTPDRLGVVPILRRFSKKVAQIPLGTDTQHFSPSSQMPDSNTIGFLGLLRDTHRYKGLAVLLDAVQILHERGVAVKLRIGGDGNLLPHYRSLAKQLGVADNVEFAGFIPPLGREIVEFYNSLVTFVLPSTDLRIENFGLVALEAAACGRPVVTTTEAGIAPIITENGCGLVVPPGDPAALAEAIQKLLGDASLRANQGRRGREMAERLSWNKIAGEYESLYLDVASERT